MASYRYERLSTQDNGFLEWETPNLTMHGGGTQIFDPGPLATPDGGVDFALISRAYESVLHKVPRYRQKIAWVPGEKQAIWVDDPHFNAAYHLRHTALPRPGSEAQLKTLAARIMERPLDRSRPLWEVWVVEGLEGGRFATIAKTHHCLVDGMGGVDIATSTMSTTPEARIVEPPRFVPRPGPSRAELRRDESARAMGLPLRAARAARDFFHSHEDPVGELGKRVRALGDMSRWLMVPASETPFNGPVGPHRILEWLSLSLADIKAVRKAMGCSVNDVVLTIVTGAVREFLIRRAVSPEGMDFRVATPVSIRSEADRGRLGNRVSSWILRLPVGVDDPRKQLAEIHETTQELKGSHEAAAVEMIESVREFLPLDIQSMSKGSTNMFVTNVPGPQFPLYLLGAELRELYVHAPLIENLGLVIGVMSYNGKVCWGLVGDSDRVPDLGDFAALVPRAFERLAGVAGVRVEGARPIEVRGAPAASPAS
ncbi:MAG: wax ester/triacylglycerol synthase family O-acyltransferase [Myxococcota bacterium]|nr:wax ester/triacylglycerol synthase family O-acyltransferase [Myxococcota bacterium]